VDRSISISMPTALVLFQGVLCLALISFSENVALWRYQWAVVEYWKFLFDYFGGISGGRSGLQCRTIFHAGYVFVTPNLVYDIFLSVKI
jgi:hypothetical protein